MATARINSKMYCAEHDKEIVLVMRANEEAEDWICEDCEKEGKKCVRARTSYGLK